MAKNFGIKVGVILLVGALAAHGVTLLDSDFSGVSAPLAGSGGWIGRDMAIQLDGGGTAGLGKGADSFVKHPLTVPENAERIRFSAEVKFSALPGSVMRNYQDSKKEQPAWIALGFTDNPSPQAGLASAKLSVSVSSDGKIFSIGLGQAVGAAEPNYGTYQVPGDGSCELALEYDFASGTATALLNGNPVRTGTVKLTTRNFALAEFQLRRIAPPGGIKELKVEYFVRDTVAPIAAPASLPADSNLGSITNAEAARARNIEARIDGAKTAAEILAALREGWTNPPSTYRPHTRWWWPGNAVTKEGIDFQLQEMKDKGFGGVEIMSSSKVYEKGNIEFGSPEFFEMVNYTVSKAHELGMEVTPPLGPGWNLGHGWVPEANRSKALVISEQEVQGGRSAEYALVPPTEQPYVRTEKKFEAVVAVKLNAKGVPDCGERIDLSSIVKGKNDFAVKPDLKVRTDLPSGKWKIMTFWTAFSGQKCACEDYEPKSAVVDHLDAKAVRECADYIVEKYRALFGGHFGQTVDSFFNDSFELHQDFTLWSTNLFDRFQREKGYDLRPYLPMIKYDGAPETPYVRYDVGSFLHTMGMEGAIGTLADYAAENGVQMRQQPHYRFVTELIEASGRLQRAETENTKRSFDPVFWHKLTTSGAQLYPSKEKKWTSAEAFTFINTRYRTTMEQIKCATDLFIRDGITQFYNHGYFYSPEKELEPARDMGYMSRISHVNTWWPWYRGLADYQARSAFLGRQGREDASVLVYSSMPTEWAKQVEFPLKNVRHIPFGSLLKILVASGYDFDCVNDDLLQKYTTVRNGKLEINGYKYSVLILPKVEVLAPETLAVIDRFVRAGGTVFALNTLPEKTTGLINHVERDNRQAQMLADLFELKGGSMKVGGGATYFLPKCDQFEYQKTLGQVFEWSPTEPLTPAYEEFVKDLRSHLVPDFEILGTPLSNGLTFRHTRIGPVDTWFICNLQPNAQRAEVILNTEKRFPQIWDPMTGQIKSAPAPRVTADGRLALAVDLNPWESCFVLLTAQPEGTLPPVRRFGPETVRPVEGPWSVEFNGRGGKQNQMDMSKLVDWAALPELKGFSGSALYTIDVDVPEEFIGKNSAVFLDLGEVHEVAQVLINGTDAGKVWMQPYRVEVSGLLKAGKNKVQIRVANLLWNYAMGLEKPTPIPEYLQAHYGTAWKPEYNSWETLQNHKRSNKDIRLPSGLLGPVTLSSAAEITSP